MKPQLGTNKSNEISVRKTITFARDRESKKRIMKPQLTTINFEARS